MKKNLRFLRLLLLSAFFLLLQPSSLWATSIPFESHGVTWTGDDSKIDVSGNVLSASNGVGYAVWNPEHLSLEFLYNKNVISVVSPFLKNVKSISFRVARTGDYDSNSNPILIRSHATSSMETVSPGWEWETCKTVLSITNCMTKELAESQYNQPYNSSLYDEVSYQFTQSFTGYLSIYVDVTPTQYTISNSYLIIPEITVTFADPSAPSPCPNCFLVTF